MPDFTATERLLSKQAGLFGIADGHGLLCGLLCNRPQIQARDWLQLLFNGPPPEIDTTLLEALFETTRQRLDTRRFDFNPFLPADDEALELRVLALGRWCQGFLTGLGLAETSGARLAGDVDEFLRDVAQIAHATLSTDEGEAGERDYAEVVEYLRVGVMLVRDSLHQPASTAPPAPPPTH
jgi:hypothetical protein